MDTYAVYAKYHYYAGTVNARKSGLIRGHDGNVLAFLSRESADEYAQTLEPGKNYRLHHGEYSPPVFRVRKYRG